MKEILKEIVKTLELQAIATGALEKTLLAGKGDQLCKQRLMPCHKTGVCLCVASPVVKKFGKFGQGEDRCRG